MIEAIMLFMFSQQIRIEELKEINFKVTNDNKVIASYNFHNTPCIAIWNEEQKHWTL